MPWICQFEVLTAVAGNYHWLWCQPVRSGINVLPPASNIIYADCGGNKSFWNTTTFLPDFGASHPTTWFYFCLKPYYLSIVIRLWAAWQDQDLILAGAKIFLFFTASRLALRSTQPSIQWVSKSFPWDVHLPGCEARHLPLFSTWLWIQRRDGDKGMIVYITNEDNKLVKKITICHDKEMEYKWGSSSLCKCITHSWSSFLIRGLWWENFLVIRRPSLWSWTRGHKCIQIWTGVYAQYWRWQTCLEITWFL